MALNRALSTVLLGTQTDARLVQLAAGGNERALEAIVERYRRPLQRYCRRFLSESRAEDAVQQTFLAAWTALLKGTQVRDLRPWLYRIAHTTALAAARRPEYDYDELLESLHGADAPESVLERRAVMRETLAAVAALPERQREALLRTAMEECSAADVASELGLSENAFRQLLFRGRTALRAGLSAVTPLPLVHWAATAAPGGVAEATAVAATGGALVKLGAAGLTIGALAVTPAVVHRSGSAAPPVRPGASAAQAAAPAADAGSFAPPVTVPVRQTIQATHSGSTADTLGTAPRRNRTAAKHAGREDERDATRDAHEERSGQETRRDSSGPGPAEHEPQSEHRQRETQSEQQEDASGTRAGSESDGSTSEHHASADEPEDSSGSATETQTTSPSAYGESYLRPPDSTESHEGSGAGSSAGMSGPPPPPPPPLEDSASEELEH